MQAQALTSETAIAEAQSRFITKVYGWMCAALVTTGLVSWYVVSSQWLMQKIATQPMLLMVLLIAELGLVIAVSAAINRLSAMQATALFFLYAILNGVTLSIIFLVYTSESIATTFLVTAGTFGAMSIYGYTTKKDLTSWGNFLFMGLLGIIIGSVVNMFWANSMLYWFITYAGIIIFVGLTAYDTQKIKQMGPGLVAGSEAEQKGAIIGALRLYLDFINLFLLLLRIFGRRR
jgi:hypothetical protein